LLSLNFKLAVKDSRPHVQGLMDILGILHADGLAPPIQKPESDLGQMDTVRILSKPVEDFLLACRCNRVSNRTSIRIELSHFQIIQRVMGTSSRIMPSPLRLCTERYLIRFWK